MACACDRDPRDIRLLAVSKTRPVADILQAVECGQNAFGENYLQDAMKKIEALSDYDIEWHFIGRIQSNKTRAIATHFSWVHTLSQLKHARRLSAQRPESQAALNVCIQVNITGEVSKSGIAPAQLPQLAAEIRQLPRLKLRGLMTMPPADAGQPQQQQVFRQLRELRQELQQAGHALDTLSMGMSNDMHTAICEGATIVRIGTAIFGPRT